MLRSLSLIATVGATDGTLSSTFFDNIHEANRAINIKMLSHCLVKKHDGSQTLKTRVQVFSDGGDDFLKSKCFVCWII